MNKAAKETKLKKIPIRTCVACRQSRPKKELARIVKRPDGSFLFDLSGKVSGHGAYLCRNDDCLENALNKGKIANALGIKIDPQQMEKMRDEIIGTNEPKETSR